MYRGYEVVKRNKLRDMAERAFFATQFYPPTEERGSQNLNQREIEEGIEKWENILIARIVAGEETSV